jgi:iron complex outermembrane receptor protein
VNERVERGGLVWDVGARLDALDRTAFMTGAAWRRSLARGALGEGDCVVGEDVARCAGRYTAGSLSVGGSWVVVPDVVDVRVDASSATRFPNVDELYMSGAAPTSPVVAVGDGGLGPETTRGVSPTVTVHGNVVDAQVSAYLNHIDDYILFGPDVGEDGRVAIDVSVQGALPRFRFRATDAWFWGMDGGVTLFPAAPVGVVAQGALVRATEVASGLFLPLIPPDRLRLGVEIAPRRLGALEEVRGGCVVEHVFEQTRVDGSSDLAPPPGAYTLVEADVGLRIAVAGRTVSLGVAGRNLLDTAYRDYTSLIRYQADEPGRSVRLRLGADF